MQQGVSAPPNAIVTVSPLDGPSSLHILENWIGSEVPTAKDFDTYATVVPIEADHTLLMSAHVGHAGGRIAGQSMSKARSKRTTGYTHPMNENVLPLLRAEGGQLTRNERG